MASPWIWDSLPQAGHSEMISAASLRLRLPRPAKKFYRHGWQSWTYTTWLDPSEPPRLIRDKEFRTKDEDPGYALHKKHISAWVGAVELGDEDILLVGALNLSGRVEVEGETIHCFFEDGREGQWLLVRGTEEAVFSKYAELLIQIFGQGRFKQAPRVWSSWYSTYGWVNEHVFTKALSDFGDMPFDVFQLDDGWQRAHGDWEANRKFPSGMHAVAEQVKSTGRTAGIWVAPFMVSPHAQLAKEHPDWLLHDKQGRVIQAGVTYSGKVYALDVSHPGVLQWIAQLIRKVCEWGYDYLKLDFLYMGGLLGNRYSAIPREVAYRNAFQVMRDAAGDAYVLACGAPVIPSLGLCDGLRTGPDVSPYWLNTPHTVWLNNPSDLSTQNSIRTSLHRLWLKPLVNVDPDAAYFRSMHNRLSPNERQLLQDLGAICGFKSTSDLPHWMDVSERQTLRDYLRSTPAVEKQSRYQYSIDGRHVDFSPVIPLHAAPKHVPARLAKFLGLFNIAAHQALPAILECRNL